EVITAVLGGIKPAAERGRAEQLVRAKLRREILDDDGARVSRRLVAMLARRGYDQTLAYDVVSTELAAERERRRV
ncbi:MAG: recombination regulator RecX, partial [Mycobacterium sp.]